MNTRMLRAVVKILRGRSLKRVVAPSPGSAQWHIESDWQPGFALDELPMSRPRRLSHAFSVTSPTGTKGWISLSENTKTNPRKFKVSGIFSNDETEPLNLGVKGYRQVFRGIRSALGSGGILTFERIPNSYRKLGAKVRKRGLGREEVSFR